MTIQPIPGSVDPVTPDEFFRLMAALGLHPDDGRVAVAVSGGADSMALALLTRGWGDAVALTFDHGLRAESADEAQRVACWLYDRGMTHQVLGRRGARPESDIQAAARRARYQALEGWCRQNGIGVLLLAHHQEDQAETMMLRLARGSGIDGLAAMAPVSAPVTAGETPLLVRPFLGIAKARLVDTLKFLGQSWIEDPSNEERDFLRVRVRQFLAETDIEGLTPARLAKTADNMRRARSALQNITSQLLRECVSEHGAGFAEVRLRPILGAEEEIALRALSRLVACYGGRDYPPRLESAQKLLAGLKRPAYGGGTVGGALIEPVRAEKDGPAVLICREVGTISDETELQPGVPGTWDNRFQVRAEGGRGRVARLGEDGWTSLTAVRPELKELDLPHPVRLSLPALWIDGRIASVPYLGYDSGEGRSLMAVFAPSRPLYPKEPAVTSGRGS